MSCLCLWGSVGTPKEVGGVVRGVPCPVVSIGCVGVGVMIVVCVVWGSGCVKFSAKVLAVEDSHNRATRQKPTYLDPPKIKM